MQDDIKRFYEKIRLRKAVDDPEGPVPVTFTHVFHKEYQRLPSKELPKGSSQESELEAILERRESTRMFSDQAITIEQLAKILRSCRIVDNQRDPERRTYPSGGARFPVELYVVAYNLEDLHPGVYHYNIKKENLEVLWEKDLREKRRDLISPYLENPAATIIFTSVLARSEVKYGPRAYPYSLLEAGHMGQNIHLVCAELGIGSCSVSGFVDDTVAKIIDLTEDEIPIYTISIGWRKLF
jgi:SagB-type dehydrogenase family enzyme